MFLPRLENSSRVDIKDLYGSSLISGDHDSAITSDLAAMSDCAESIDGFDEFSGTDREDLNPCTSGDSKVIAWWCKAVQRCGREGNMRYWIVRR